MSSSNKKYEVLAPAGSMEQLRCAVHNGCDSVYLGLDCFNARMKAPNFTQENIGEVISFCHFFDVKVYVTVNTSVKNDEFVDACNAILCAYNNKADGVIVTDLALLKYASCLPKPFDVVASTQLNANDAYGARFLRDLGANTIVCARECSLQQINDIASVGTKVETFIHGARCVCQSGQCLFSSIVGGNSGNRGLCAQPCRKTYAVNGKKGYFLSARDMCGLSVSNKLVDAGATVFKIEGRNRRAEYAGITSKIYRKCFDENGKYTQSDVAQLAEMYNRNMSGEGYLLGKNDDIVYPDVQNHVGVKVGTICGGVLIASQNVNKGDGFKILDRSREVGGGVALNSGAGKIECDFTCKVRDGMTVWRTTNVSLCKQVNDARRTVEITIQFTAKAGKQATITASSGKVVVSCVSDFLVEQARKHCTTSSEIVKQLQKIGDFSYTITNIVVDIDDIFLAKSQINAMRREVLDKLTLAIVNEYNKQFESRKSLPFCSRTITSKKSKNRLAVTCYTLQQVKEVVGVVDFVVYKPSVFDGDSLKNVDGVYLDLPSFCDNAYVAKLIKGKNVGVVCHNVGSVQMAREHGIKYIAGQGLNVFNDYILQAFDDAQAFVYSYELSLEEIGNFSNKNGLIFIDGKLPLMKLVHCPYKAVGAGDCARCQSDKKLLYRDELGNDFEIFRRKDSRCTFELFNGKKLSATDKITKASNYLVDYDKAVIEHFLLLNQGKVAEFTQLQPYTKGRLYNKIN